MDQDRELVPASLMQVMSGRGGRLIAVEDDVGEIVAQIKAIDPNLSVHWNDKGEYFVIKEKCEDGKLRDVTTCNELDGRILDRLRMISKNDWDAVAEMERMDEAADRANNYKFHEEVGDKAEVLAHALRKDLNPGKIFIPKSW